MKKKESLKINGISAILKLVGEESRLKLLCLLRQNEHCVCELIKHVNLSQSLISHHLQDLKGNNLVYDEKRGAYVYYALTDEGRRVTDLVFQI